MWAALVAIAATLVAAAAGSAANRRHSQQPTHGFYDSICPSAETVVRNAVRLAAAGDATLLPAILRLHFHDCFVQGCDASVLLDVGGGGKRRAAKAEKEAAPNRSLRGFEVIDAAKEELERRCPNLVSCADILAFAARDSVHLLGGPFWPVAGGRLDGFVSDASLVAANLPSPSSDLSELTRSFARKGLTQDEMVTLSGAHTVGSAHCTSFENRIFHYDPAMPERFVAELQSVCPAPVGSRRRTGTDPTVALDAMTPMRFDNAYYANLELGQGLLQSDAVLFMEAETAEAVRRNAAFEEEWLSRFAAAMAKMSRIGVKEGTDGEVRRDCRKRNE